LPINSQKKNRKKTGGRFKSAFGRSLTSRRKLSRRRPKSKYHMEKRGKKKKKPNTHILLDRSASPTQYEVELA